VILLAIFTVIEVSWYLIYAFSSHKLSRYLQQTHVMKNFNRDIGGVFMGFTSLIAANCRAVQAALSCIKA
jgi:threonine/homoserine/homoserine lactone efflux protein